MGDVSRALAGVDSENVVEGPLVQALDLTRCELDLYMGLEVLVLIRFKAVRLLVGHDADVSTSGSSRQIVVCV